MADLTDMTPTLGMVTEPRRIRNGGAESSKHLLVLLIDGKPLCPLAEFRGDNEANWARKLLGLEDEPESTVGIARAQGADLSALIED